MNIQEYHQLRAEQAELEQLLEELPTSSVIERMGLESRKKELEDELAAQPVPPREPVRARLTFCGKPVVGSHGMFAEFGAAAVTSFVDAVAAIGASQSGPLGTRGSLPSRDDFQLLITGTALGSFGFELEEAPRDNGMLFPELSLVEAAIEQTKAILEATIGTDDELADAMSEAAPRALESLRTFLKTLADQEAVCALEFKDKIFRFTDVGQVCRSADCLSQDNIHEDQEQIKGVFQGILPKRRIFEFRVDSSQEVISGKVGPDISDPSAINRIVDHLTMIEVMRRCVGSGRPRYLLLRYNEPACKEPQTSFVK